MDLVSSNKVDYCLRVAIFFGCAALILGQQATDPDVLLQNDTSDNELEWFPLLLSFVALTVSAFFTSWVMLRRNTHALSLLLPRTKVIEDPDVEAALNFHYDPDEEVFTEENMREDYYKNYKKEVTKTTGLDDSETEDTNVDETNVKKATSSRTDDVLIAWRNVSCTYPAKRSGQPDQVTLENAHGAMRTGELTALMGPRYVFISLCNDILLTHTHTHTLV